MNTVIKGNKVYLRQLKRSDLKTIYSIFSDDRNSEYELYEPFKSLDDAKAYFKMVSARFLEYRGYYRIYAIVANNNKMVGLIESTYDKTEDAWVLGYTLEYDMRHKGYMSEAIMLIAADIVQCRGHQRFIVKTDKDNKSNIEMLQKLGFKFLGQYGTVKDYKGKEHFVAKFVIS